MEGNSSPTGDLKTEPHPERGPSRAGCMEQHYVVQEGRRQVQTFKDCMMTFQKAMKKQLMRQAKANIL
uniref:Uncharacterized protein n=1 Tax=Oncorhynchus kisutch TaxID=8019 RepID=A0A8C7N2V7_ONCKI